MPFAFPYLTSTRLLYERKRFEREESSRRFSWKKTYSNSQFCNAKWEKWLHQPDNTSTAEQYSQRKMPQKAQVTTDIDVSRGRSNTMYGICGVRLLCIYFGFAARVVRSMMSFDARFARIWSVLVCFVLRCSVLSSVNHCVKKPEVTLIINLSTFFVLVHRRTCSSSM